MNAPAVSDQPASRPEDEVLRRRLDQIASIGLKKLRRSAIQVRRKPDSARVHDVRIATRRLQALVSIAPLSKRRAARLTKRLKRLRHGLAEQRDRDVMQGRLRRMLENSADPLEQRVWQQALECVERDSAKNSRTARHELHKFDEKSMRRKISQLMTRNIKSCDPWVMVNDSLQQAARNWRLALRAAARGGQDHYHPLRIKTKTLRYSLELANYLLTEETENHGTAWLKEIQDRLGAWHDEIEFSRYLDEIVDRNRRLRDEPAIAAILTRLRAERDVDTQSMSGLVSDLMLQERSAYVRSAEAPARAVPDERGARQMARNLLEVVNKA